MIYRYEIMLIFNFNIRYITIKFLIYFKLHKLYHLAVPVQTLFVQTLAPSHWQPVVHAWLDASLKIKHALSQPAGLPTPVQCPVESQVLNPSQSQSH